MTQTAIGNGLYMPALLEYEQTDGSAGTYLMDASGEKVAVMFTVPKTGTLDGIEVMTGNSSQIPASGVKISFQDRDAATGFPDGTADQYRVVTGFSSAAWVASGIMSDDGTNGGNKRSVTAGQQLCVVFEFQSFAASDQFRLAIQGMNNSGLLYPAGALNTGSWAWATKGVFMVLKYSDSTYEPIQQGYAPMTGIGTLAYASNNATQDEAGMIFRPSVPITVSGAWMYANISANADVVLYGADGTTALQTLSIDSDDRRSATSGIMVYSFPPTDLSAGSDYRLILKPTTTTNVTIVYFNVNSTGVMGACTGGANWHWTARVDAGSWTQNTTRRPFMGLYVTKFSDGAGGSGGGPLLINGGLVQ